MLALLVTVVLASGCTYQQEGPAYDSEKAQQVNGMDIYYGDSVPESYVQNFATRFNSSDDIDRTAIENTGEGYEIKIYTKRSSVENINNLDTQSTTNTISQQMFDNAELTLYIANMDGKVAQKASSE